MSAKILVVDDEPDLEVLIRQKFRRRIRREELQFIAARNGVEALEKLAAEPDIDMVLTDINMPEMDGLTLLKKLSHLPSPTLKTVVISAYGDLERIRTAMNLGAFDFLTKPIDLQDLEITIDKTLNQVRQLKESLAQQHVAQQAQAKLLKHEALQESERRLTQFLEAMPIGVFVISAAGTPFYANQAALELLGQDLPIEARADELPRLYQAYVAGTSQLYPSEEQPIVKALGGETATVDDIEIRRGDRIIPIEVTAQPIFGEGGEILYAIAAFKDITRRKQAEAERVRFTQALRKKTEELAEYNRTLEQKVVERTAQLAASKHKAESANRAKSTFLANMSHELRTPLNAILGFTQLMGRSPNINPKNREHLEIIGRSGEHLLTLINDVLAMSKIEAGRIILHETRFDLYDVLTSLEEMLELKASDKGVQLIFKRDPDLPRYIETDESKLRQVLLNLLGNAIKFTAEGQVALRVSEFKLQTSEFSVPEASYRIKETLNRPFIQPTATQKQATSFVLHFEVEDTGPGIAPAEVDALFEPFVQTETGRQSQSGTGLGLPISREFVRLMGGELQVKSAVGKGTCLTFDLPVTIAPERSLPASSLRDRAVGVASDCHNYRILVVEDKADNLKVLVELLTQLGFQVQTAVNGREAVNIWASWQPHFVWMDIRMPVMDGCQATQLIRQQEAREPETRELERTAIVALTAIAFEEERAMILAAGCDDVVLKPFQESSLLEKMSEYLEIDLLYEQPLPADGLSESGNAGAIASTQMYREALASMSSDWIAQLHQAAVCADGEAVLNLLEDLPANWPSLHQAIAHWVKNFQFECISNITQSSVPHTTPPSLE